MRTTTDILDDIRSHPEVDAHRLEYADACAIKDPDLARYIRDEIAYWAVRLGPPYDRGSEAVAKRLAHPFLQYCYGVELYRGFVEEITIDPYVFLDRGDRLLDLAPIRKVTFSPKPLPPGMDTSQVGTIVPSPVPELMASPLLGRVYSIAFRDTHFQLWSYRDPRHRERARQPACRTTDHARSSPLSQAGSTSVRAFLDSLWDRAFERPEFRKMIRLGFPAYPGEGRQRFEQPWARGWEEVTEVTPMPEHGRALEQRHGYLPLLHAVNKWGEGRSITMSDQEIVLAVLRGTLPKFPVGAPVTEEMYALPPPKRHSTATDDW